MQMVINRHHAKHSHRSFNVIDIHTVALLHHKLLIEGRFKKAVSLRKNPEDKTVANTKFVGRVRS